MKPKVRLATKHETARARMQAEQEKLQQQLNDIKTQALEFERTNFFDPTGEVKTGSLVETDKGNFLISVPIGKIDMEEKSVYVISPVSPIGQAMKGLKEKSEFEFNKLRYKILSLV